MKLPFSKMHGLGNDFMVLDGISQAIELTPAIIRRFASRQFGIGFNQLLLVEPPQQPDIDFKYRIFNADGSEVEQCGNGARCFAKFVRDKGLTIKSRIAVETRNGIIHLHVEPSGMVRVDMGVPILEPVKIPFKAEKQAVDYIIRDGEDSFEIGAVSMGNPHAIMLVDDINLFPVRQVGRRIEAHQDFPQRVNAGFLQVVHAKFAKLRVYERGVGETLACGTGACAAHVYGRLKGLLGPEAEIKLPGGSLHLSWAGEGANVYMTGPATHVFEGVIDL
ncbi:diaminopimelate epimerase [Allohahella marinimesophila]|uniref:Diaminopimelate epimerase n=1 Tax=Allohahella marinimesophila TaxID=1054972 RepID=A0ABP7P797_9GAMM